MKNEQNIKLIIRTRGWFWKNYVFAPYEKGYFLETIICRIRLHPYKVDCGGTNSDPLYTCSNCGDII